jgi:hypothetical protein
LPGKDFILSSKEYLTNWSGETLNKEFFNNLRYFKKISNLPAENLFLVYGGELNQSRKQGQAVGWKNIVKPPYL